MEQSISNKIIRNTFFNAIGRFWDILILLVLTPYIISSVGNERYGIWAIVGVVTGYFGMLDFGVGTSFIKYISEYYTVKDYKSINEVVNTGFVFYFVFALMVVCLSFIFIDPLLRVIKIAPDLYDESLFVFLLGIILFGLINMFNPITSIQAGLQRMDITNKVNIAVSVPFVLGTIYFLENGYGIKGLMVNNAIVVILKGITSAIISFKILPELKFNPLLFTRPTFKKLISFGYKLQISRFANLVSFETDKIFITYFLGIGQVVFYQLGSAIVQKVRQMPLLLISALIPAVSEMGKRGGKEALCELYLRGSKYLIFVSTPILFFLIVNASLIILAWMGAGYGKSAMVIQVLAAGYYFATVTGVASSIAAGMARTDLDMKFGILLAVMNLFLSIYLIIKIGFVGVVAGTAVSLSIASFFFVKIFHSYLGTPLSDFIKLFYKPIVASLAPAAIVGFANYYLLNIQNFSGRAAHITMLCVNVCLFGSIYLAVITLLQYLDSHDKGLLGDKIPFANYFLR